MLCYNKKCNLCYAIYQLVIKDVALQKVEGWMGWHYLVDNYVCSTKRINALLYLHQWHQSIHH